MTDTVYKWIDPPAPVQNPHSLWIADSGPYILCANGRHTFVWSPHAPHGSFDYAAPEGLRCQCGQVEYKPVKRQQPQEPTNHAG